MKPIIISFDDIADKWHYDISRRWELLLQIKKEIPELKVTFFTIYGCCSDKFLKDINQDWIELAFHSKYHDLERQDDWVNWDKERAKEELLKSQKLGLIKGLKGPHWKLTIPLLEACKEMGYWICIPLYYPGSGLGNPEIKKRLNKFWITKNNGWTEYPNYIELWAHPYDNIYYRSLEKLREYVKTNKVEYKFMSEVVDNEVPDNIGLRETDK